MNILETKILKFFFYYKYLFNSCGMDIFSVNKQQKMNNDTKLMLFQQEKDDFDHPFHIKVTMTVLSILIILSMVVIKKRLFKFFRRPNKRLLDRIVDFQMSVQIIVVVLTLLFFNPLIWAKKITSLSLDAIQDLTYFTLQLLTQAFIRFSLHFFVTSASFILTS